MAYSASYKRWLKAQKAEVAAFKPIVITYTISECPDCYGALPQGSESAHAKGCYNCRLFDYCSDATERVDDASLTEKEWKERANRYKEFMNEDAWKKRFGAGQKKID